MLKLHIFHVCLTALICTGGADTSCATGKRPKWWAIGGVLGTSREGELERKRYTFALSEVKCSSCTFSMSAWRLSSVLVVQTQVAPLEKGHIPNIPASPQLWPCCFRNEAVLEKKDFCKIWGKLPTRLSTLRLESSVILSAKVATAASWR